MKIFNTAILLLLFSSTTVFAQNSDKTMTNDQEAFVQVLDDFKSAIIDNDQEQASSLLTKDARILEGGGIETKKEYLSHHFHSDGKFLSAMDMKVISRKVKSTKSTAWVSTTSSMKGTYNDREMDLKSAELAVLVKTEDRWKISAVHWSSR
ncbi:YybH family protein [Fodinibius halophilus]|uniref:Nuclear transport factor 2 family protein n=1 Tax=Fodinibius halophilus TaxID=1736908 RepID=A0A6M1TGY7_9BACT|nr:nuclear transport factor 2 family protein [Fodinibius halophilus]NGP90034.1 nuclear transport factor 2 family protein [Fodinibius halophilus]